MIYIYIYREREREKERGGERVYYIHKKRVFNISDREYISKSAERIYKVNGA